MDNSEFRDKSKKLVLLLFLHSIIIPSLLFVIARMIWGVESTVFLGLIAAFAWIFLFGGATIKKMQELQKKRDEKKNDSLN